jgi:hypothetical protein
MKLRTKKTSSQPPHLTVVVTDAQLRKWRKAARLDSRSLSSWVRVTLDFAVRE